MSTPIETDAHILLADISGYTRFLRENTLTLRHANYIVSELLAAVMRKAEGPVRVEKLEGDAVLFVAPTGVSAANEVSVRRSLFAFPAAFYRRRAELMADNTCPCEACAGINRLDLKVIGHYGRVLRYRLERFDELAGIDLVIAHRLLKNSLEAPRYLMLTEPAWSRLNPDQGLAAVRRVESCEGVGEVPVMVLEGELAPEAEPPRTSAFRRIGDFLVKHLMLLPFGEALVRRAAERAASSS